MHCWLAGSLRRFYPRSPAERLDELRLAVVRGERASLQIVCRGGDAPATVSARVDGPEGLQVRIRRAGLVPVPHFTTETSEEEIEGIGYLPGFVPDPLLADIEDFSEFPRDANWIASARAMVMARRQPS